MPLTFKIEPVRRLITLAVVGEVSDDDVRALERELLGAPDYDSDFDQLVDIREGKRLIGSADVLREMAAKQTVSPGARRALVTGNLLAYGLARLFQTVHDAHNLPDEVRVFRNIDEAWAWLATPRARDRKSA